MSDHLVYLEGVNLGLAAAIAVAVAGLLMVVPENSSTASLRAALALQEESMLAWQDDRDRFRAPSAEDWAASRAAWQELLRRVPEAANDADLMASVSRALHVPSLGRLQIERVDESNESSRVLVLSSPEEGKPLRLVEELLRVRFHASYADTRAILARFESRRLPARLEVLEIRRNYPGVAVDLRLGYFVRKAPEQ